MKFIALFRILFLLFQQNKIKTKRAKVNDDDDDDNDDDDDDDTLINMYTSGRGKTYQTKCHPLG